MRTTEEIYEAMTETLAERWGRAVTPGGDLSLRLYAVAAELYSLEAQAEFTERQSFPQTAAGEYLDRHALLRGLSRKEGVCASGVLRFVTDAPRGYALSIPAGTQCRTAAGTAFRTTQVGVIPAGQTECLVAAEAVLPGSGGCVPAGAVCMIVLPPVGVTGVDNPADFSGGCDVESDGALRERVLGSYRSLPNGANAAYYVSRVRDLPGVAEVVVLPKNRGIGTVDIVFSTENGVPTEAERAAVEARLNAEREICVDVKVQTPQTEEVDVTAELTVTPGRDAEEVLTAAETALHSYFSGRLLGRPVYRAKLAALLMAADGVENCVLSEPEEDLDAESGVLPVAGTITLSEAV